MKTKEITYDQVVSLAVPPRTETYMPVSNRQLLDSARRILEDHNLPIQKATYQIPPAGNQLIAYLHVGDSSTGLQRMLGLRNSYDKSRALAVVGGASVFICSNGVVSGEIVQLRKHTGGVLKDLDTMLLSAIGGLDAEFERASTHRERFQEVQVTKHDVAHILGELFYTENIIRLQQLQIIRNKITICENFRMDSPEKMNVWNLYNNVTEALKTTRPELSLEAHANAHKYFLNLCGGDIPQIVNTPPELVMDYAELVN